MTIVGVIICLTAGGAIFLWTAYAAAKMQVKSSPRQEMYWCHKHGHFRKGHVLSILGCACCPRCWLETWTASNQVQ